MTYIYESPDNGKTVTRRISGSTKKEIRVDGKWYMLQQIDNLIRELELQLELRKQYPAVQAAWDNYNLLVSLARTGELDKEKDG